MRRTVRKPSDATIRRRLKELREFIDDNLMERPFDARVAYIWETEIRWATDATDWPPPLEHVATDAQLLRHDLGLAEKES